MQTIYRQLPEDNPASLAESMIEWIEQQIGHGLPSNCTLAKSNDPAVEVVRIERQLRAIEDQIINGTINVVGPQAVSAFDTLARIVEGISAPGSRCEIVDTEPLTVGIVGAQA